MGEANRRKKLDPTYGKPKPEEVEELIEGITESEWREGLGYTKKRWKEVKPYLKVIKTRDEIEESIEAIWLYKEDGKQKVSFTGSFAQDLPQVILQQNRLKRG